MVRGHEQKEDYMNKDISKPEEREARSEVRVGPSGSSRGGTLFAPRGTR